MDLNNSTKWYFKRFSFKPIEFNKSVKFNLFLVVPHKRTTLLATTSTEALLFASGDAVGL
jgi:hypothetical protein